MRDRVGCMPYRNHIPRMKQTTKGLIDITYVKSYVIPLVISAVLIVFLVYDIKCDACITNHVGL